MIQSLCLPFYYLNYANLQGSFVLTTHFKKQLHNIVTIDNLGRTSNEERPKSSHQDLKALLTSRLFAQLHRSGAPFCYDAGYVDLNTKVSPVTGLFLCTIVPPPNQRGWLNRKRRSMCCHAQGFQQRTTLTTHNPETELDRCLSP